MVSKNSEDILSKRLDNIEERLENIETHLNINSVPDVEKKKVSKEVDDRRFHPSPMYAKNMESNYVSNKVSKPEFNFTFNQVITFLGILGIIIGLISFFFYAVARNWIGESMQVLIGILIGFGLFGFAYQLRDKNLNWSNIVFGGAYFVEFLTITVGINLYQVIPKFLGLIILLIFVSSSTIISLKFSSRIIAYFSVVGGFLIPYITYNNSESFLAIYYLILAIVLVVISQYKNWADLRLVSFIISVTTSLQLISYFKREENIFFGVFYILAIFILYNIAAVINSKNKDKFSPLDSILIGLLPLFLLSSLNVILNWSISQFGILVMIFSFLYLAEMAYFKFNKVENDSLIYTLFSGGLITLNLGLLFIFESINMDYYMILFVIQWFLFTYLSINSSEDKKLYDFYSFLFYGLNIFWYISVLRFDLGIFHATFFMILLGVFVYGFKYFADKNYNFQIMGASFVIGIFLLIYSFSKWLVFFIKSGSMISVILSILWLIYTLSIFQKMDTKEGKTLVGVLLGITLLKIAFVDLFYLNGAYRIIGFILFGVLLLIGGYFIKNDKKD